MSAYPPFSQAEAVAKIGRIVRTRRALARVPLGATGRVVRADPGPDGWHVAVEWHVARNQVAVGEGLASGDPFVFFGGGGQAVDWFSRAEYEQWLEELPGSRR